MILLGYILALAAVLCGTVKGFCGKKISTYTADIPLATHATLVRMGICILFGFGVALLDGGLRGFEITVPELLISALSGITTAIFVISWLFAIQRGAYMLVDAVLALGIILPIVLAHFLYREYIDIYDILGFSVLLCATFFLSLYSNQQKRKLTAADILLLILVGLANGTSSFAQKMFVYHAKDCTASVFNFYTYVFAMLFLLVASLFIRKGGGKEKKPKHLPGFAYLHIAIMAICLFGNSYLKTLSAEHLTSAQLFPLSQGAGMILSAIMAAVFFGERINARLVIGLLLTFAGLLIMNLL